MRGAEGSGLTAVQPLKCHPDKARNQLEDSTSGTLAHKQHKHSCRAVRRCWLQPPERCIIHARPTKRASMCVDICVAACVGTTCSFSFFFFFEGRKSVEVKGRGWSHLTASPLEKFIKRQLKMSTWASFLLLFPFLYSNCTSIPPLRYQPNVLKIAIGLLFVLWYEYKEFPMSF